jgi:hypothetical protein
MPLSSVNAVRGQAEIEEARQQMDTRPLLRCTAQPRTHVGESIHDISRNVSMVRYVASVVGRSSPESVSGVFRPCRDEVERCGAAWKRDADSSRSSPNYAPQATIQTSPPIRCFSRLVSVSIKAKYRFISRRTFLNHGTGLDTLAKSRISRSTSLITPFFRKRLPPSELSTETRRLSRKERWISSQSELTDQLLPAIGYVIAAGSHSTHGDASASATRGACWPGPNNVSDRAERMIESTTGATVQMCLIAVWNPSSLAPGPPPTTLSPPDTHLDERFCCGRSRSPAAKARRDTSLKPEPKPFCCVKLRRDHYLFVVALGCCEPVFSSYSLTTPPTAIPSIWPVTL